ncbi:Krueppel homolog 1-like isoform X2 [Topomyia yanbarensis]|uniref:Krueppel homolog 1-like isoform X2 n=1 Tax=Topomyia yanbarensis TaxID=2498891 RepID=UPI00273C2200|nr:Krueppel homolog 1-like isoform X2 [Topomyia yanbarensis]
MDLWDKQDWIKDILSKSGTEIKEVPAEDLRKMVYYTGLPLLMQQADGSTISQLCFSNNTTNDRGGELSQQQQQQQQQQQLQQQRIQFQQQVVNLSSNSNGNENQSALLGAACSSTQPSGSSNSSAHLQVGYGNFQPSMVPTNLVSHQSNVSGKFRCEQCNINFGSKSAHTSHMKSHAKQLQQLGMTEGGKLVSTKTVAAMAIQGTAASVDPYQCDVCKKTFAVPARLVRHYRTHTGERPFECDFCHKMFSVKENLQVHRRIHTKERPYKCEICDRAFEHSGKLHRHMRIHTGERPHKCSVCGKTFIQSGQLVIHMRTHTGEKPYKCPVEGCGKGFTCSKQLKVHSRTHTGEKPYHCDICFRDFGYNHVLKLHRVQHYGSKCYKCTICDETFKSKKEMEAHIKGHAKEAPEEEANDNKTVVNASLSTASSRSSPEYSSSSSNLEAPDSLMMEQPMELEENLSAPRIDMQEQTTDGSSGSKTNRFPENIHFYSQFEQSVLRSYGVQSGVNPALLAAASIAAAATEIQSNKTPSPPPLAFTMSQQQQQQHHQQLLASTADGRLSPSAGQSHAVDIIMQQQQSQSHLLQHQQLPEAHHQHQHHQQQISASSNTHKFEPMAVMKNHGYFAPASQVTEFRSSSDIVRQVEAAIAGTENLLTPPRSSPESPDRSSSPESDSVLMADRDNNTLPPRKRRLYFKDQPARSIAIDQRNNQAQTASAVESMSVRQPPVVDNPTPASPPPVVRMSSVIQYAKASYE